MLDVDSSWPRSKPLLATLSAALSALERGNAHAAPNQLSALQNKARAQVSDQALAREFIEAAQRILDVL